MSNVLLICDVTNDSITTTVSLNVYISQLSDLHLNVVALIWLNMKLFVRRWNVILSLFFELFFIWSLSSQWPHPHEHRHYAKCNGTTLLLGCIKGPRRNSHQTRKRGAVATCWNGFHLNWDQYIAGFLWECKMVLAVPWIINHWDQYPDGKPDR